MDPQGIMEDGLKIVLVTCGNCGQKHLWDYVTKARSCPACDSVMVLKTISEKDLGAARKQGGNGVAYSDYLIYKISVQELETIKSERKALREMEKAVARANGRKR